MGETQLRQKVVQTMARWLGAVPGSAGHAELLALYNGHRPLARGYAIRPGDAYCAAAVSAAWIGGGAAEIAVREVSVPKMVKLARDKGIWVENDAHVPAPGDAVVYDWQDDGRGDNRGSGDHVGLVERVSGGQISVIEGNMGSGHLVGRRTLAVDGRYIRGFICPDYGALAAKEGNRPPDGATPPQGAEAETEQSAAVTALAREVIAGRWGNGSERRRRLTAAGHDYAAVQAAVNRLIKGASAEAETEQSAAVTALAREVIAGRWGNGSERRRRLTAAGHDYAAVQAAVNRLMKGAGAAAETEQSAAVTALAREVIAGRWGNGTERRRRLTAAGHDYAAVQAAVNRLMRRK